MLFANIPPPLTLFARSDIREFPFGKSLNAGKAAV